MKHMFEAVRDYRDPKGERLLCQIFMKLPSRIEYPDYYEVIKHPIDMERIAHKMKNNFYESVEDLVRKNPRKCDAIWQYFLLFSRPLI